MALRKNNLRCIVFFFLSLFAFLCGWAIVSKIVNSNLIVPGVPLVFRSFLNLFNEKSFYTCLLASFFRVLLSVLMSVCLGLLLGIFAGLFESFENLIKFPLSVIRSTPVVSLILIAVFWFDSSFIPVFSAVLMALPVVTDSVAKGIKAAPKKNLDMAFVYKFTRSQKMRFIYIPSLRPFFESSCRSSFGMCWKVVAAGEVLVIPRYALGSMLQGARVHLESERVLAVTFVIVLCSVFFEFLFDLLSILVSIENIFDS